MVPAHDRAETIGVTLDSLLAQTHADWEAIVVDDGSTDATADVVEGYAARDDRIRLHRQRNAGVSAARNAGIALARRPWLMFLDADDWITPDALARLCWAARAAPEADAVYGGYVRITASGVELPEPRPPHDADLFALFARTCAIAIHTCIVRTELVRAVGGFDTSLVTCEDWDLWQKLSRIGVRWTRIPEYIAYYRMRSDSASSRGAQMLVDGMKVIDRGHAPDPRLTRVHEAHLNGLAEGPRNIAHTYFCCYAAGLEIGAGRDPRWMLDILGERLSPEVDPDGVAETLFRAVPFGRAAAPSDWHEFPPEATDGVLSFMDELARRAGHRVLAVDCRRSFEHLLISVAPGRGSRTVGRWHVMELELGQPVPDVSLPASVERIRCAVCEDGSTIGIVELPASGRLVPAAVLADAIAAELAWELLERFLSRDALRELRVEAEGDRWRVLQGDVELYTGPAPERGGDAGLNDVAGWALLLQDLWDLPGWTSDRFYEDPADRPQSEGREIDADAEELPTVEISGELPTLATRRDPLPLGVAIGGVPLGVVAVRPERGRVRPPHIRRDVCTAAGFELCIAAVREAILLAPPGASGSLRERLAAQARQRAAVTLPSASADRPLVRGWEAPTRQALPAAGGRLIGRRAHRGIGGAVSRAAVLPPEAAGDLVEMARAQGEPVVEVGPEPDRMLLYAPWLAWDPGVATLGSTAQSTLEALHFDALFAHHQDPWQYDSEYERRKYEQTLALIPHRVRRALEVGCAEGHFTERLAPRVQTLVAVDISSVALNRAARRCARFPNVTFVQLDAFRAPLPADNDLVVCSEVLYYAADRSELERAAHALADALADGGTLVCAHANALVDDPERPGFDWDVPFGALGIERALCATGRLELREELHADAYRVQRYERVRRIPLRRRRREPERTAVEAGAMPAAARRRFRPEGGEVRRDDDPGVVTSRLPILMYHRVAPEGAEATRRWRLTPEQLESQLRFLRDAGYRTITFDQWAAAAELRRPVPGRAVILTFDDGYADFVDYAEPLLRKYGFGATLFVVTDLVGRHNAWDDDLGERLPLMGWEDIRRLHDTGFEIGSHSSSHGALAAMPASEVAADLARSRRVLHERLGVAPRSVSYPFGLQDPAVRTIAGGCGFDFGVTTEERLASVGGSPLDLPRLEVRGTDGLREFKSMLAG